MMRSFMVKMASYKSGGLIAIIVLLCALPLIIGLGWLSLVNEILIIALAACALNIMMGYTGMVSFGPAGLYAVGAYTTALLLTKTGTPFAITIIAGPAVAGLVGVVVGWFCVRRTAVYFALLTLAFAQIIWTIIFEWYGFTGGDNGIVGIDVPEFLFSITAYYYFTLVLVAIYLSLIWMIVKSPFGKVLQAIRENPGRAEFVGINVRRYQLAAFVLSSFFLGAAGSLFCGFSQSIFPDCAHWGKSADIIVICLLGGMYHFAGPIIGSFVYILLSKLISSYTMYWMLFLGIIVVLLVLFMRGGIMGFVSEKLSSKVQEDVKGGV